MTKKNDKKDITVEEVTKDTGLFTARLSKTAEIHGVKFNIRPLPNIVQTHITGKIVNLNGEIDLAIRKIEYIRFGITCIIDVDGEELKDIFTKEKIMGRPYSAINYDFIDESLPPDVLDIIFTWIVALTHLSKTEIEKLDFTIPSPNKK